MRKFFKRIAAFLVTAHSNRIYRKAVAMADRLHGQNGGIYYVMANPSGDRRLLVLSRKGYRRIKDRMLNLISRSGRPVNRRDWYMNAVKGGCYYHTADKGGNGALSDRDREIRRLAFVRDMLVRSGL